MSQKLSELTNSVQITVRKYVLEKHPLFPTPGAFGPIYPLA